MANGQQLSTLRPKQESHMDSTILVKCKFAVVYRVYTELTCSASDFRCFLFYIVVGVVRESKKHVPLIHSKESVLIYIFNL